MATIPSTPATPDGEPTPQNAPIPPDLLLRRDRSIRYERGGAVYATDGRVGYLRQVVVDEAAIEVVALVVEIEQSGQRVFVSPELVDKTAGAALFLSIDRAGLAAHVASAPPYRKDRLEKANLKALRGGSDGSLDRARPRRAISRVERDAVVTPTVSSLDLSRPSGARLEGAY